MKIFLNYHKAANNFPVLFLVFLSITILILSLVLVGSNLTSSQGTTTYVLGRAVLPYDTGTLNSKPCNEFRIGRVLIRKEC